MQRRRLAKALLQCGLFVAIAPLAGDLARASDDDEPHEL